MLGVIRTKYKFRSSNNRKRRKHATAHILRHETDGGETPFDLTTHELPFMSWALPTYNQPGIVWQAPYQQVTEKDRMHFVIGKDDVDSYLDITGGYRPVSVPPMKYHLGKFTRFIAKVAHSFASAVLRPDGFKPILQDFILNGHEKPRIFIGGEPEIPPAESFIYEIKLGRMTSWTRQEWVVVSFRMLSYLGAPTYIAVVGEGFQQDISLLEYAAYAKPIKVRIMGSDGEPFFTTRI